MENHTSVSGGEGMGEGVGGEGRGGEGSKGMGGFTPSPHSKWKVRRDPCLPSIARGARFRKLPGQTPPPAMSADEVPWRGQGGRPPTMSSVEFDRQLDKISVWLEGWTHEQETT
ncbi:hypothetical protein MAR_018579 [Mya arenaria]|uniref:Uncharacterized protein n=1 Tax=Mya arenaria TaxID=6604 RepID=A0ABY7EN57_MYAAR|nr:hypothetical protein MAR_018579 [Mya arenaria]